LICKKKTNKKTLRIVFLFRMPLIISAIPVLPYGNMYVFLSIKSFHIVHIPSIYCKTIPDKVDL